MLGFAYILQEFTVTSYHNHLCNNHMIESKYLYLFAFHTFTNCFCYRFTTINTTGKGEEGWKFSYNPCKPFDMFIGVSNSSTCKQVAVSHADCFCDLFK